jgi:DNA-binding transcriptional regulator YiaG
MSSSTHQTTSPSTTTATTRIVPSLPQLPTPFNNTHKSLFDHSIFDHKPITMSSHHYQQPSSISDRKPSKASDTSSILSTSTTSSMSALLKSKLTPKSKSSKSEKPQKEDLSPGEKQAIRRKDRMSYQTLATIASMK